MRPRSKYVLGVLFRILHKYYMHSACALAGVCIRKLGMTTDAGVKGSGCQKTYQLENSPGPRERGWEGRICDVTRVIAAQIPTFSCLYKHSHKLPRLYGVKYTFQALDTLNSLTIRMYAREVHASTSQAVTTLLLFIIIISHVTNQAGAFTNPERMRPCTSQAVRRRTKGRGLSPVPDLLRLGY